MIHTIKFLNDLGVNQPRERCLSLLSERYGIKVSHNEDYPDLYCLNYDQINSPKLDPITRECRSFVIEAVYDKEVTDEVSFRSVSRSFDRFYNLTEDPDQEVDISTLTLHEKLDGSLVSVFHYEGEWIYRTKSMIMPEEDRKVNGGDLSWKELIEETCMGMFRGEDEPFKNLTFIFEVVSPDNRVVTKYKGRMAYMLAARGNMTGEYIVSDEHQRESLLLDIAEYNISMPKTYSFSSLEQCQEVVNELPNLEEGYVGYNSLGVPVVKIKSPAYLAAHRLKGESVLSGKRIMDMLFIGEEDEYLAIFPEDVEKFLPYQEAYACVSESFELWWGLYREIEDKKEYALRVKRFSISSLLFTKKKNKELSFQECFDRLSITSKYTMVESYL
jgi:hypothetical protein